MQNTPKAKLTEGPIAKTLIKLTIPMVFAMLGMIAFNLIDTFFVGQLGTNELAAMGFTFPVVMIISSVAMGLGIGASAVISRAIGEGNHDKVKRLTTDSLVLAVVVAAIFVLIGVLTIDPVFKLMGATPEIVPLVRQYMLIWYIGVVFLAVPMVGNNAIRATGDTKTPAMVMMVAIIVNITLDPLLIFGIGPFPRLELQGAAITTVIARAMTFLVSSWVLYKREKMITLKPPALNEVLHSWKQVLFIGLPTAATNMIIPLAIGVVTSIVAAYGPPAVAGFGASTRVDLLALSLVMSLSAVLAPFVGQNWGAGNHERVWQAVSLSHRFAIVWGLVVFVVMLVAGRPIAGLFNDNPEVIATMTLYFSIVPLGYGLQGVLALSNAVFNVLNKPMHAAALTSLQMFVLLIPLSYAGSYLFGLPGIFASAVVANMVAGLASLLWLRRVLVGMRPVPGEVVFNP